MGTEEIELKDKLISDYKELVKRSKKAAAEALENSGVRTAAAWDYGENAGKSMEAAIIKNAGEIVSVEDGYYAVRKAVQVGYDDAAEYAAEVLTKINKSAGINLKAQAAAASDMGGITSQIAHQISNAETVEECKDRIKREIAAFTNNAVADTIEKTAGFQSEQGMNPKIIRTVSGETCEYCQSLAGTYIYPCDKSVYCRHKDCDCVIEYVPVKGGRKIVPGSRRRTAKSR